jgi:nitrite reductase/ring-hydroxylating ferredoxin subunit
VLTCTLHGWQFELESGRCLTSDDRHLYTQKIDAGGAVAEARSDGAVTHAPLPQPESGASIRDRCYDCWYDPKKFKGRTGKAEATEGE